MKAAVFHGPGVVKVEDIPVPDIGVDELLVAVRAASICGTDLRIAEHGHFKLPDGRHRVLGHETAGVVVEVGPQARGFAPGDRVSITPNIGCGHCRFCRRGLNNMCPDYEAFGITIDGGFEEYLRVPGHALQRGNVFRLPDNVSFATAALLEPFSCCLRGQHVLDVGRDDIVVIVGAGPIGIFHTLLAKLSGAAKVIVANRSPQRLDRAREAGADVTVLTSRENLEEVVMEQSAGRGADVVLTCVSDPAVQTQAVTLLATHGRLNFFSGLGRGAGAQIDTNRVHYRGLVLTGTTGSSNSDYERSLALVTEGRVDLSRFISRTFDIEQIGEAMEHASSGAGMKAMVTFPEEPARLGERHRKGGVDE
ncbi:zinc-dependent dehydrogenase [Mycolicibacterium komossense]|uniref:Alcohol dehydrogenase catalytic domain-containing protein n=1 Tax=Mycolicibacterium komossense TaxID=1779 RepID=A0ABT3CB59_9MYCO|nr:zinc-dependent dehydrogenase [Mycolicibacterium komossense]MCV7226724.1 alcohol dehydrogenase catalytic domain-containing protein [Mycolicibacterium komossense]